jgi:polyhydroxybutyrate depolymerase
MVVPLFLGLVAIAAAGTADARLLRRFRQDRDEKFAELSLSHKGLTRWFFEYRPTRPVSNGSPLVLVLHGGTESMKEVFHTRGMHRWIDVCEKNGFLMLVPNAVDIRTGDTKGDNQNWNDYRNLHGDKIDDTGFFAALVNWAIAERGIDASRVYLTGHSNGGMMSYRALIETSPPTYAAAAVFIANLSENPVPDVNHSTPIFIMNGNKDRMVDWKGGPMYGPQGSVRSALATRDYWIKANGVDVNNVQRTKLPNANSRDKCRIASEFYPPSSNLNSSAPVQFYTMEGAGHMVPYTDAKRYPFVWRLIAGPACWEVEGAEMAWKFLSNFTLSSR